MIEYDVRAPETGGTGELVKICNSHAQKGWRLVSTAATVPLLTDTNSAPAMRQRAFANTIFG